jgi:hypothetical protein
MNMSAQNLIKSFDRLPKDEQQAVASEILKRALILDLPSLSDEELTLSAEELFLDLDRREAKDAQPKSR